MSAVLSWVDWVLLFWVRVGRCRRGQAKTFGFQVAESAVGPPLQPPPPCAHRFTFQEKKNNGAGACM